MNNGYFGDECFDRAYFTGEHPAGYPKGYNRQTLINDYDCYTKFKEDASYIKSLGIETYFEIGCASGFLMEELLRLGVKISGWDISRYIVKQASPAVKKFIKIKNIAEIGDIPDKSFDLVHVSGVLGYVPLNRLDYYLERIARIAKKYVIVYVGTPHKDDAPEESSIRLINKPEKWWNARFAKYLVAVDEENCLWRPK